MFIIVKVNNFHLKYPLKNVITLNTNSFAECSRYVLSDI